MPMVQKIGLRYAARHSRHPDEAVAEAYYQLTILIKEKRALFDNAKDKDRLVGTFVKRAVRWYFVSRMELTKNQALVDKVIKNTDEEMIEWLSGLLSDDDAFKVFDLVRNGINLFEVEMVDPLFMKIAKRLRLQVAGRIKRLERLKKAGLKPTREIKYDRSLETGPEEDQEDGSNSGERERGNDSPIAA